MISAERSREDLDTRSTRNANGDTIQTIEVRAVSFEAQQNVVFEAADTQGCESADVVVVLDDGSRTASVSNVSKVDSERRDVVKITVAAADTV